MSKPEIYLTSLMLKSNTYYACMLKSKAHNVKFLCECDNPLEYIKMWLPIKQYVLITDIKTYKKDQYYMCNMPRILGKLSNGFISAIYDGDLTINDME